MIKRQTWVRAVNAQSIGARIASLALVSTLAAHAEMRSALTPEERTNGRETLSSMDALKAKATPVVAKIVDANGKQITTATWIGEDGYFLTKASDAPGLDKCRIEWGDDHNAAIREIRRESAYDLVLAQAVGVKGVHAVTFDPTLKAFYGQWLTSPVQGGRDLRIGVISAQGRSIRGEGAAIGVTMGRSSSGKGVLIMAIAEDSPAQAVGLRANDIILEVEGQTMPNSDRVKEMISVRQPGEEIEIKYLRGSKEMSTHVRLASRTKVLANQDGEDFGNGGISLRTDNFAQVLQHDLPLRPQDMGTPLMDLEGRAIGINIARVDRVTTFALPSCIFWSLVQGWMENDRHPPKAVKP